MGGTNASEILEIIKNKGINNISHSHVSAYNWFLNVKTQ